MSDGCTFQDREREREELAEKLSSMEEKMRQMEEKMQKQEQEMAEKNALLEEKADMVSMNIVINVIIS